MEYTTHYNLKKPDGNDTFDEANDNANMDAIDAQMYANAQAASAALPKSGGTMTGPLALSSGLTGAQGTGRWAGVTTTAGAPTSGTFAVGDWVLDPFTPSIWVCTSAGTPGTWGPAGKSYTAGTGINIDASNKVSNTGVTSFNGSAGDVTYAAPVTSVNGQTGAVTVQGYNPLTNPMAWIG